LRDVAGQRERHARVNGVGDDEAVRAHVRLDVEVAEVEGREHGVLLDADEGVVDGVVAAPYLLLRGDELVSAREVFA
jgi:hypothetical protein